MMDNKFIALAVGLTVGVIMLSGFLWPVVADATATETTYTNEGYFRMTHYGTDENITLIWDAATPKTVLVNDVEIPINYNVDGGQVTLVADTNFIARLNTPTTGITLSYVGSGGGTHSTAEHAVYVFSEGTATITNTVDGTEVEYTSTYEDLYLPSLDGPFIMKAFDKPAYVNEDSEIFAYGLTRVKTASGGNSSSPGFGIEFSGNIADGLSRRIWRTGGELSLSNEQINYTEDSTHTNLYKFDSITATGTYTETVEGETVTTDTPITYNYLLVPYQVTAEKSWHLDTTQIALVAAIGTLGAIVLIAAAAGSIRRLD